MNFIKNNSAGIFLCLAIALPSWLLGRLFPVIGGAIISILAGMTAALFIKNRQKFEKGIKFTSKKILQWAVILLGFGMNLTVILEIGRQSLPIIISTITASLIIAYALHRAMKIPSKISTLVGVGSSICGGSAIAATAPVIDANDEEVAQAIIPITLILAFLRARKAKKSDSAGNVSIKKIFPFFILYFIAASIITTVCVSAGIDISVFSPLKELSKFFIVLAMAAIGLNTDIVKLIKTGGKPLTLGFCCWAGITAVSLIMQHMLGIW